MRTEEQRSPARDTATTPAERAVDPVACAHDIMQCLMTGRTLGQAPNGSGDTTGVTCEIDFATGQNRGMLFDVEVHVYAYTHDDGLAREPTGEILFTAH